MPYPKKTVIFTESLCGFVYWNSVLFFEENWNLEVKAVLKECLNLIYNCIFEYNCVSENSIFYILHFDSKNGNVRNNFAYHVCKNSLRTCTQR